MEKTIGRKSLILLAFFSFLLTSCGKNVSRDEAIEILDKIQKALESSQYSLPVSFTETAVYSGKDQNGSFYCSYDLSNHYYHEQTNYTIQQAPGKTMTTYDEYYYYVEDSVLYYVNLVSKVYTKQTVDAEKIFSEQMSEKKDINGYPIPTLAQKVIENGPSLAKEKLSSTPSTEENSVSFSEEKYLTLGDDSLDAFFTRTEASSSVSNNEKYYYSFLKNQIQEMDKTDSNSSSKLSFSWDNVKTTKPDFNGLTSQTSSSASE